MDEVWDKIKGNLRLCLINSIETINIENEIKKEESYKRKFSGVGDKDEPSPKTSRW